MNENIKPSLSETIQLKKKEKHEIRKEKKKKKMNEQSGQ